MRVWIYSLDLELWYSFSGILADHFFEQGGNVGFFNGSEVCVFSEELRKDLLSDGEKAAYDSHYAAHLSFSYDLFLLFSTVFAVLSRRHIREGGGETATL